MVAGAGSVCGEGGNGDAVYEGELFDGLGKEEGGDGKGEEEGLMVVKTCRPFELITSVD